MTNANASMAQMAEALARIEHKLDILLRIQISIGANSPNGGPSPPATMDKNLTCPVCGKQVRYNMNFFNAGVVVRSCGCKTGLIPIDLDTFSPGEQNNGRTKSNREDPDGD